MPSQEILDSRSLAPHSEALKSKRAQVAMLRELARSDRASAQLDEAKYLYFTSMEQMLMAANAGFAALDGLHAALRQSWYVENAPYDSSEETTIVEAYRSWLIDSDEASIGIERFASEGRQIQGTEDFRENVLRAQAVVEDDAIRKEARRMTPSREKLDALARLAGELDPSSP